MKQKNYIIKLLLKTWLGILCFSLLCTFCAVWLLFQNTKQSSYNDINIVYEGILLTWAIIGVIMFSVGTFTLFLNYFPIIRYNNIYSFLSFFLVPMLLILLCGTEILCLWTVKIPFIVCLSGAYLLFRNKIKNELPSIMLTLIHAEASAAAIPIKLCLPSQYPKISLLKTSSPPESIGIHVLPIP